MTICSLASGSAGNATFIRAGSTRILIDAGLSVKQLVARLAEIGEKPENLSAILITHEHADHVAGLARLVKHGIKRGRAIPVYLTARTAEQIWWDGVEAPPVSLFQPGKTFVLGDLEIVGFTVPHDCVDPVSFVVRSNGSKMGIATDLGYIPDALRANFRDCQAVLIESNHDTEMLRCGPHPNNVKIRVAGRYGHLSNADTIDFLSRDLNAEAQHVMLLHLSQDNNMPELALGGAGEILSHRGMRASLSVATQDRRTEIIEI